MAFVTLEDETGLGNMVLRPPLASRARAILQEYPLVVVEGVIERAHNVTNLVAVSVAPLPAVLARP